jgi:hypothetical protein
MTEAEAVASLNGMAEVTASLLGVWVSITFAYLTASYFLGKQLSTFQSFAVSGLYVVTSFVFGGSAILYVHAWQLTRIREGTVFNELALASSLPAYVGGTILVVTGGILISLYFMYNVRHSEKAQG